MSNDTNAQQRDVTTEPEHEKTSCGTNGPSIRISTILVQSTTAQFMVVIAQYEAFAEFPTGGTMLSGTSR